MMQKFRSFLSALVLVSFLTACAGALTGVSAQVMTFRQA